MIFGDSSVYGAWDNNGGWVNRLREPIDVKNLVDPDIAYFVYNLGIPGNTSVDVLKRFEAEYKERLYPGVTQETIVIFGFGANDSMVSIAKDTSTVPIREFESSVNRLADLARERTKKVIFIGPAPVDESKVNPIPWDKGYAYKNARIKEYDNVIKAVCRKKNIMFFGLFDELLKLDYKTLLEDGAHFSPAGHMVIYELVREYLTKNKILNFETPKRYSHLYKKFKSGRARN
ncbi:MAG: GDSL-type esterase/lipase family protein [Candidatus Micrarchaeales archaeon]|nr:GDSL-type esterase/lipase family protein [Candidatus Micrarchaeales archaeon]